MPLSFPTISLASSFATSSLGLASLHAPFTLNSLSRIRATLAAAHNDSWDDVAAQRAATESLSSRQVSPDAGRNAAVLIPFCNVDNRPGILFQVRGKLRMHSGEVSFPGGRVDPTDTSFLAAALRETHEEVGIPASRITMLGPLSAIPPERSLGGLHIWTYAGFFHSEDTQPTDPLTPLPSITLSSLQISEPEVAHVFHLPLSELVTQERLRTSNFRARPNDGAYFAVRIGDLVTTLKDSAGTQDAMDTKSATMERRDRIPVTVERDRDAPLGQGEIKVGEGDMLEIWGLTGWYLSLLMRVLGLWK